MRPTVGPVLLLLIFGLAGHLLALEATNHEIRILRTGQFYGHEVPDDLGHGWFGLFSTGEECQLLPVSVRIQNVHHPCVDLPSTSTGKRITIDSGEDPLLLVQGIPDISKGRVETVFHGRRFLYPGEHWSFQLGREWFILEAFGTPIDGDGGTRILNYAVKLSHGKKSQKIVEVDRCFTDGVPLLLWMGDLDRDGIIDLHVDTRENYRTTNYSLFLSSPAQANDLVRRVADFMTGSC